MNKKQLRHRRIQYQRQALYRDFNKLRRLEQIERQMLDEMKYTKDIDIVKRHTMNIKSLVKKINSGNMSEIMEERLIKSVRAGVRGELGGVFRHSKFGEGVQIGTAMLINMWDNKTFFEHLRYLVEEKEVYDSLDDAMEHQIAVYLSSTTGKSSVDDIKTFVRVFNRKRLAYNAQVNPSYRLKPIRWEMVRGYIDMRL